MSIPSLDLDLDLPTNIPELPPPWPPTEVAIEWWLNGTVCVPSLSFEKRLRNPHREHHDEPFVLID